MTQRFVTTKSVDLKHQSRSQETTAESAVPGEDETKVCHQDEHGLETRSRDELKADLGAIPGEDKTKVCHEDEHGLETRSRDELKANLSAVPGVAGRSPAER